MASICPQSTPAHPPVSRGVLARLRREQRERLAPARALLRKTRQLLRRGGK